MAHLETADASPWVNAKLPAAVDVVGLKDACARAEGHAERIVNGPLHGQLMESKGECEV